MEPVHPVQQLRGAEAFLQTEEEVNQLLHELTRLRQEAESYASAKQTVDKAAAGVSTLSTDLVTLAGRLREIVDTLRSISTPEILDQLQGVKSDVSETRLQLHSQLEDSRERTRTAIAEHVEAVKTDVLASRQQLNEKLREGTEELRTFVSERIEQLGQQTDRVEQLLGTNETNAQLERARLQRFVLGLGAAQVVALMLILWKVFA